MARKINLKLLLSLLVIPGLIVLGSCNGGEVAGKPKDVPGDKSVETAPAPRLIEIVEPAEGLSVAYGEKINVQLRLAGREIPDSVRLYFNGVHFRTLVAEPWSATVDDNVSRLGKIPFKAVAYKGSGRPQTVARFVNVYSDIVPPVDRYRVVATYPHDIQAYTQGLLCHNGYLYESTGQNGRSSLRQVETETGRIVQRTDLESKYFGEGLALLNEKLYQLTWLTNTGFVYDINTFTLIGNIHYNTQGWGLTTDGEKLIMSDGTNKLYFLEPDYFTVLSTLEVFDNREAVWQLNELEYINGEIWANIYQTERLARIDPESGRVLSYVDLAGLLTQKDRHPEIDYLNGIAWEKETGKIFVTGKNWPKLFEIKVIR